MNVRGVIKRSLSIALLAGQLVLVGIAAAANLDQVKTAGWVGERLDGYLGIVKPGAPKDVLELVNSINGARKAEYERIAKSNRVSVKEVGVLTAQKVIKSAAPGTYVQNAKGQWVQVK